MYLLLVQAVFALTEYCLDLHGLSRVKKDEEKNNRVLKCSSESKGFPVATCVFVNI